MQGLGTVEVGVCFGDARETAEHHALVGAVLHLTVDVEHLLADGQRPVQPAGTLQHVIIDELELRQLEAILARSAVPCQPLGRLSARRERRDRFGDGIGKCERESAAMFPGRWAVLRPRFLTRPPLSYLIDPSRWPQGVCV